MIMMEKGDNRAPDDFMQLVINEFKEHSVWSATVIDLKDWKAGGIQKNDSAPSLEAIKDLREACTNEDGTGLAIAYWFCRSDRPVHEDDYQPFILVNDGDKMDDRERPIPLIAALVSGKLRNYQGDGTSGLSNAFYYSQGYLVTQAEDWMDQAGHDIEKVDAILGRKAIVKNLGVSFGDDPAHTLIILADSAKSCRSFSNEDSNFNNFDWGWTSDSLGWGTQEAPFIEEKKEEPPVTKVRDISSKKTLTTTKSTSTFTPTPTITGTGTQNKPIMTPPKGATPESHPQWFTRPDPEAAKLMQPKNIIQFYQKWCVKVPSNPQELPWMLRKSPAQSGISTEPIKSFEGLKQIASVDSSKSNLETPPIITALSTKWVNEEFIPKYYDVTKKEIKDPYKFQYDEKPFQEFSKLTPLGFDLILGMPISARKDLLKEPSALINWTLELSNTVIRQNKELVELRAKLAETGARLLRA